MTTASPQRTPVGASLAMPYTIRARARAAIRHADDQLRELAALVARELACLGGPHGGLVDAATLARMLELSAATVRAKAKRGELPGRRVGTGPRARWRFDPAEVRAALGAAPPAPPARPRSAPRRRARAPHRPEGGWRV